MTGELFEEGADDAAINPYDDLDDSLVARGPLVELEDDDDNFQVGGRGAIRQLPTSAAGR